jgi:hypothetical protein
MSSVGFEPTISASKRPQIYVFDRTATGTGTDSLHVVYNFDWEIQTQIYFNNNMVWHTLLVIKVYMEINNTIFPSNTTRVKI